MTDRKQALQTLRDKAAGWAFRRDETNGSFICFAFFGGFMGLGEILIAIAFFIAGWAFNLAGKYWRKKQFDALISEQPAPKGGTP